MPASGSPRLPLVHRATHGAGHSALESLDETPGLPPLAGVAASAPNLGRHRGILGMSLLGPKGSGEEGKGGGTGQVEGVPRAWDSDASTDEGKGDLCLDSSRSTPQAAQGEAEGSRGPWRTSGGPKSASAGEIPLERPPPAHQRGPGSDVGQVIVSRASVRAGGVTAGSDDAAGGPAGAGAGQGSSTAGEGSGALKVCMPQPRTSRFLFRMKSAQLA